MRARRTLTLLLVCASILAGCQGGGEAPGETQAGQPPTIDPAAPVPPPAGGYQPPAGAVTAAARGLGLLQHALASDVAMQARFDGLDSEAVSGALLGTPFLETSLHAADVLASVPPGALPHVATPDAWRFPVEAGGRVVAAVRVVSTATAPGWKLHSVENAPWTALLVRLRDDAVAASPSSVTKELVVLVATPTLDRNHLAAVDSSGLARLALIDGGAGGLGPFADLAQVLSRAQAPLAARDAAARRRPERPGYVPGSPPR